MEVMVTDAPKMKQLYVFQKDDPMSPNIIEHSPFSMQVTNCSIAPQHTDYALAWKTFCTEINTVDGQDTQSLKQLRQ